MLKIKEFMKTKKSRKIYIPIILLVVGFLIFYQVFISKGSSYNWIQSDWSGGADTGAVATHTDNQTGWTKFFSKDDNVDTTTTPGEITLIDSVTEDENTLDADFAAMTQSTDLSDSGDFYINGDSIQLKKQDGVSCTVSEECISGGCSGGICYEPWFCGDSLIDSRDSKTYSTVQIDTQCWMAENLNVGTKLAAGTTEPANNGTIEKWCYDNNDANCTTYGGLYQWDEAMQYSETEGVQGICPVGWHIPTDAEYYTLESGLATGTCSSTRSGYDCDPAGTALKVGGSSGFEGILAGRRFTGGSFGDLSSYAYFWSSSVSGSSAWTRFLGSSSTAVGRTTYDQIYGFSVRCLKD